jgi:putative ABC transport system permease protein
MNIMKFTILSIKGRKLNATFTVIALTLAVTLTYLVLMLSSSVEEGIKKQSGTYDLIVGAEGSPTQLVLNSVMYADKPVGNIPYSIYEKMLEDERILRAVPLALGDSYYGLPIIGTTLDFFKPYREGLPERYFLKEGTWFEHLGEVIIGSYVAKQANLTIGQTFHGNHGLGESDDHHEELTYKIVGILEPTGTADDKGIFTPIESVWEVHGHGEEAVEHSEENEEDHAGEDSQSHAEEHTEEEHEESHSEEELEITALLLKPEKINYIPNLQQELNDMHEVQAIFPVRTFRQLLETFDYGKKLAYLLTGVSIILAGLFILFAIISSIHQRKQETSILKSLGVPRSKLLLNVLLETSFLAGLGTILGVGIATVIFISIKKISLASFGLALGNIGFQANYMLYAMLIFIAAIIISVIPIIPYYFKKRRPISS